MKKTLFEKIWEKHVVDTLPDGTIQLYIDRLYCHEVTSPQAFAGLRERGLKPFRPSQVTCIPDHNVPTLHQERPIEDPISRNQVDTLEKNARDFGLTYYGLRHPKNGIIHVVGPENGLTQPGMTIVCGDSHTSTHGAMGAIAFGIGTSEVEMTLATQCIMQRKPKTMRITLSGQRKPGVTAKDIALYLISRMTTGGATGYFVEYAGEAIRATTMEERLTICNLSIEMGARGGMIAPDEVTFAYLKDREFAPRGDAWEQALASWRTLRTDDGAAFDREVEFRADDIEPMVTYGTNPGMAIAIGDSIPTLADVGESGRASFSKALEYMGFRPGDRMIGKPIDYVFLGSCTNGRIEDFRAFASVVKGRRKADGVTAWLVPGSWMVEKQIRAEGIDRVLEAAGFELRQPGCSACLAMNDDKVPAGKYAVSTSNRNFEGRQGPGARTILAGPLVAAAAAVTGIITDPSGLNGLTPDPSPQERGEELPSENLGSPLLGRGAGGEAAEAVECFTILTSTCIPLPLENVDTDQIIPARFLKATTKEGFGDNLFRDWRYDESGAPVVGFVLNQPVYRGQILVAGKNFGCGSSREHAAWAITGYGFRAVVSSFFADIFKNNSMNNGLLPVVVSPDFLAEIFGTLDKDPSATLTIDLPAQTITNNRTHRTEPFDINPYKKDCLVNGLDDIDYLLTNQSKIEAYERDSMTAHGIHGIRG